MKIDAFETNVLSSNVALETTEYTVAHNGFIFQLLSSKLYSDKIAAVLREIGCNAADAHVEQGNPDVPFEVKLPNKFDPTFYIKDFGPGLSDLQVRGSKDQPGLYLTYGDSTKRDSNDKTGMLGVGSKSPFAYTSTFTVTTVKDGSMRTYLSFVTETGGFGCSLVDEQPASPEWPHGLMVSFPVKPADIDEFHAKALQVFKWFDVPPRLLGIPPSELEAAIENRTRTDKKHPGLCLEFANAYEHRTPLVLMGNIAYPVDMRELDIPRQSLMGFLLQRNVVLRAPIGTVSPSASREHLEYNARTKAGLNRLLAEAAQTVVDYYKALVADTTLTDFEKASRLDRGMAEAACSHGGMGEATSQLNRLVRLCSVRIPPQFSARNDPDVSVYVRSLPSRRAKPRGVRVEAGKFSRNGRTAEVKTDLANAIVVTSYKHPGAYVNSLVASRQFDTIVEVRGSAKVEKDALMQRAKAMSKEMHGIPVHWLEDLVTVPMTASSAKPKSSQGQAPKPRGSRKAPVAVVEDVSLVTFGSDNQFEVKEVKSTDIPASVQHYVLQNRNGSLTLAESDLHNFVVGDDFWTRGFCRSLVIWAQENGGQFPPFLVVTRAQRRSLRLDKAGYSLWGDAMAHELSQAVVAPGALDAFAVMEPGYINSVVALAAVLVRLNPSDDSPVVRGLRQAGMLEALRRFDQASFKSWDRTMLLQVLQPKLSAEARKAIEAHLQQTRVLQEWGNGLAYKWSGVNFSWLFQKANNLADSKATSDRASSLRELQLLFATLAFGADIL